jgi:hypothetical protein
VVTYQVEVANAVPSMSTQGAGTLQADKTASIAVIAMNTFGILWGWLDIIFSPG